MERFVSVYHLGQAVDFLPKWTFPSSKNDYRADGAMLPVTHRGAKRNSPPGLTRKEMLTMSKRTASCHEMVPV